MDLYGFIQPKLINNLTCDTVDCFLTHCVQDLVEDFREWFDYLFCYTSRYFFIIRLCYSAGNACKRVTISAEKNGFANGILKICGIKEANYRCGTVSWQLASHQ